VTRRRKRVAAVLGAAAAVVVLTATPASAHATLLETDPAAGEVLEEAPRTVTLTFSEAVEASLGAVRVFDGDGERIDAGEVSKPSANSVRVALPRLDDGSFIVTYRVTSADAHPVQGAFTFQVGAAGNATSREVQGLAAQLLGQEGQSDRAVGALFGVARGLAFGGLALLIGGTMFAAAVWRGARSSRRARRLTWLGWWAALVATVAGLLLQGPYAAALPLGDAFDPSVVGDVLDTRFGQVSAFRLLLLLIAAVLVRALFEGEPVDEGERAPASRLARPAASDAVVMDTSLGLPGGWLVTAAVVAVALAATPGLAGHAGAGDDVALAVVSDTLHVLAMAVWLGGLVVLAAVALPGRSALELKDMVPRFSRVALGSFAVIAATGAYQTWRQVGSLDALRNTEFGRILVVKLVLVGVILVFAAFSREIVARLWPPPRRREVPAVAGGADDHWVGAEIDEAVELRHLRRTVWVEIAFAAAALAATALLVNAVPAKTANAEQAGGATGVTMKSDEVWVDVTVAPARTGRNDVHVSALEPAGAPKDVAELTISLDLPGRAIGPIDVPLRRLSPGHYLSPGLDIPLAGEWRVTAKARLDDFDQPTVTGRVDIT
jgi:copper transport protein